MLNRLLQTPVNKFPAYPAQIYDLCEQYIFRGNSNCEEFVQSHKSQKYKSYNTSILFMLQTNKSHVSDKKPVFLNRLVPA